MTKSKPSWNIRPYQPGDEIGILELEKIVFVEQPPDRFSPEYWHWEFAKNSSGFAKMWVADDNGKIVGYYAVIPRSMKVASNTQMGSIVVDVMTHPDYRKQGMFTALGKEALPGAEKAGIEFSFGFPIRKEVMPGHLKIGWRHIFDIPVLVRPLKFKPIIRHYVNLPIISSMMAQSLHIGYKGIVHPLLKNLNRPLYPPLDNIKVRQINSFDERFDELWQSARQKFSIIGIRDQGYLNWRYVDHPYHSYRILAAEQDENLLGYIVTRTGELLGFNSGIIVDVLAHPDYMSITDVLLTTAITDFEQDTQLDLIASLMTKGNPYFKAMHRHGLITTPSVFWFILHNNKVNAVKDELLTPENWYLTWGDTDVI